MAFKSFTSATIEDQPSIFLNMFDKAAVQNRLNRICNNIYKLLPMREEEQNWVKPLETLIIEIAGYSDFISNFQESFLVLLAKMQGLIKLQDEIDFSLYRRTIFECCNLVNKIQKGLDCEE